MGQDAQRRLHQVPNGLIAIRVAKKLQARHSVGCRMGLHDKIHHDSGHQSTTAQARKKIIVW